MSPRGRPRGQGRPRGLHLWSLGLLLFLIYVNDLPQKSQISTTLFADDTPLSLLTQIYQDWKTESIRNCTISLNG